MGNADGGPYYIVALTPIGRKWRPKFGPFDREGEAVAVMEAIWQDDREQGIRERRAIPYRPQVVASRATIEAGGGIVEGEYSEYTLSDLRRLDDTPNR